MPEVRPGRRIAGRKLHLPARRLSKMESRISYTPPVSGNFFDRKQQAYFDSFCRIWRHSIRLDWPENPHESLGMMIFCTSWYIDNDQVCKLLAWYRMVLYPDAKRAARKLEDPSLSLTPISKDCAFTTSENQYRGFSAAITQSPRHTPEPTREQRSGHTTPLSNSTVIFTGARNSHVWKLMMVE